MQIQMEENNTNELPEKVKKKSIIFHIVAIICISMFCAALAPKTLQNDTFYKLTIVFTLP